MTNPPVSQRLWAQLRDYDRDRYLTARFAPRKARASLMTLYSFNAELARIPDLVSEPALGEFRLQWWRDTLAGMAPGRSTGVPLADALAAIIRIHDLRHGPLLGMIDARSADLDGGGFRDMQALKAYLYKTEGAVFSLSAQILGGHSREAERASNAAGLAYGLVMLLRNLPRDAAAGRVMVPLTLLQDCDLNPEMLLAGKGRDGVLRLVADLSRDSHQALGDARRQLAHGKTQTGAVFAPLHLVECYLDALGAPGHDPLRNIADINPLVRFWRLWRAARGSNI